MAEDGAATPPLAWRVAVAAIAFAGVACRLSELGAWGLSNDEAWVGLATRVDPSQFRLAIAMTPIGWAALVKAVASVFGGSELVLRTVPFAFGCLAMRAAERAGYRLAGHPLGGALALAAVAFDPLAIDYSRILKQYTAEAFFCIVTIDRAAIYAYRRRRRDLAALVLLLTAGLGFTNSQILLAPPTLAALLADAAIGRDRRRLADVAVAAAVVGVWDVATYRMLLAPHLPSALDPYWSAQTYLPPSPVTAARLLWERLGWTIAQAIGPHGVSAAGLSLVLACFLPRTRVPAVALALLVAEIGTLSMLHVVPVSQPRILVFLTTALEAFGAAAVALVLVRAAGGRRGRVLAAAALAALAYDAARAHGGRVLWRSAYLEDAGPLVRLLERDRRPDDLVLLHQRTHFVFAFYQRATPVLVPSQAVSVGYIPRLPDAAIVVVNDETAIPRAQAALQRSPRVWVLASRLRPWREHELRRGLASLGTPALDERRPGAFLLLLTRSPGGT
jgi:hypothetical protein